MRLRYDPHPGVAMVRNWIDTLKEKTGRTLDEWVALAKKKAPAETKERREWLKREHGLGTNSAWWIVDVVEGTGDEMGDVDEYLRRAPQWVEAMFAGPKAALLPAYERLYTLARTLDVKISPGKTIVPIYRSHVIAQIKPTTRTRQGPPHRHRRPGEEGPHHAPHRDHVAEGCGCVRGEVAAAGL